MLKCPQCGGFHWNKAVGATDYCSAVEEINADVAREGETLYGFANFHRIRAFGLAVSHNRSTTDAYNASREEMFNV